VIETDKTKLLTDLNNLLKNRFNIIEKPWVVNDDQGVPSYSLQAPAVAVSLIKQLVKALGI
jgi:hypothetical protein